MKTPLSNQFKKISGLCLISFPTESPVPILLTLNLLEILRPICKNIIVLSGNYPIDYEFLSNVQYYDIGKGTKIGQNNKILPLLHQLFIIINLQLKSCYFLLKERRNINVVFFYVGGGDFILPLLISKVLKKKVIFSALGLGSLSYLNRKNQIFIGYLFYKLYALLEKFNLIFSDIILVESKSLVDFLKLNSYRNKIFTEGARFINFQQIYKYKKITERTYTVGYIGRLEYVKGIQDLLKAIPFIINEEPRVVFFIGGSGSLEFLIKKNLSQFLNSGQITFKGWIDQQNFNKYLNEIKIFCFLSYQEGLPTIILEAMASGSIIMSTSVGGIPDIIKNGVTGFILKDNSQDCILASINEIFANPLLEQISDNAVSVIKDNYSYEKAVERYRTLFKRLY